MKNFMLFLVVTVLLVTLGWSVFTLLFRADLIHFGVYLAFNVAWGIVSSKIGSLVVEYTHNDQG